MIIISIFIMYKFCIQNKWNNTSLLTPFYKKPIYNCYHFLLYPQITKKAKFKYTFTNTTKQHHTHIKLTPISLKVTFVNQQKLYIFLIITGNNNRNSRKIPSSFNKGCIFLKKRTTDKNKNKYSILRKTKQA